MKNLTEALTFDDVLIVPSKSSIKPSDADVATKITKNINLKIPLVSAAMDTVTESKLAIKIAQMGGLGIVHKNMSYENQANEIMRVKRFESGMVVNPVTINPENSLNEALIIKDKFNISGIPVVKRENKKLVGILTNRDIRFAKNLSQPVESLMTKENLVTVTENISMKDAQKLLHKHRIEKLLVVDNGWPQYGISSEIISIVSENLSKKKINIQLDRLSIADLPIPSTRSLAKYCYPDPYIISKKICNILNKKNKKLKKIFKTENLHDVPDKNFRGPF